MRKFSLLLVSILLLFVANSCIKIEETYTFAKNGSGSMEYKVDMSEMMEKMQALMGDAAGEMPANENSGFTKAKENLLTIPGISGIKMSEDAKKGIYSMSFKFKNIDALNKALNYLMMDKSPSDTDLFTFIKKEGNKIHYQNTRNLSALSEVTEMMGGEDAEAMGGAEAMAGAMESMTHTLTIKLPKAPSAIYTGLNAEDVQMNGKEVKIVSTIKEWMDKGDDATQTSLSW
jgi:hypothetical protein